MIDIVSVGKNISIYRKKLKLSQLDLANKVYVSRQTISKWETGCALPSLDVLIDLSKLFNISIEELLCLDQNLKINKDDIFNGHNRLFIINGIINKTIDVNIIDVFPQMTSLEKIIIIKAIKENKLSVDRCELYPLLSPSELSFLNYKESDKNDLKESSL